MSLHKLLVTALLLVSFNSCTDLGSDGAGSGEWLHPPLFVSWQWQLSGDLNIGYDVEIYDIDLFDNDKTVIEKLHSMNREVVCYFSAGTFEEWREDASYFREDELGNPLEGWPGERWVDIRSENVREIIKRRLDLAKKRGCDGVEPDNMDGYLNDSGFDFGPEDQLDFNRFVANESHKRGMFAGLKNDFEQTAELVDYFDFALSEECFEFDECGALSVFVEKGKAVLNVEYDSRYRMDEKERTSLCENSLKMGFSTLVLPRELDDSFRFGCI